MKILEMIKFVLFVFSYVIPSVFVVFFLVICPDYIVNFFELILK